MDAIDHSAAFDSEVWPRVLELLEIAHREGIHLVISTQYAIDDSRARYGSAICMDPERMPVGEFFAFLASLVAERLAAARKPELPTEPGVTLPFAPQANA